MATYQEQIARRAEERAARDKAEEERKAALLSPEQISLWRLILANMGIPFAMSMPEETIQRFKDRLQARINASNTTRERSKEE